MRICFLDTSKSLKTEFEAVTPLAVWTIIKEWTNMKQKNRQKKKPVGRCRNRWDKK